MREMVNFLVPNLRTKHIKKEYQNEIIFLPKYVYKQFEYQVT